MNILILRVDLKLVYYFCFGESVERENIGEISMNASDIVNALPEAWKNLTNK